MTKFDSDYLIKLLYEILDNVDYNKDLIAKGFMDDKYLEFEYRKGQINYENICRRLKGLKIEPPKKPTADCMTLKDFKEHILEILSKILGNEYYSRIKNVPIILENKTLLMDGAMEVKHVNGKSIKEIKVGNELYPLSVAIANHEIIHLFIEELIEEAKNVIKNIHYHELPSILIEYITIIELDKLYPGKNIIEEHLMERFKNDVSIQEQNCIFLQAFEKQDNDYSKKRYNDIKNYFEHSSYGYIISNIMALKLLEIYNSDEERIKYLYKKLLSAEKDIIELLKEFNLSLNSKDTINPYIKKLEYFEQKNK